MDFEGLFFKLKAMANKLLSSAEMKRMLIAMNNFSLNYNKLYYIAEFFMG